jgi:hypothetical protein
MKMMTKKPQQKQQLTPDIVNVSELASMAEKYY